MYFMKWKDVHQKTKISRSSFYRGIKAGTHPAPLRISERSVVWKSTSIDELMQRLEENQVPASRPGESAPCD